MNSPIEVLITLPLPDDVLAQLRSVSPRLRFTLVKANQASDVPAESWQSAEVLYSGGVLPQAEQVPRLKWIQFHYAGVDHAISDPILQKPDLVATTLSGAAASQMAEYILMMLLALGHRLPDMLENQKKAEWPRDRWKRFLPQELRDSTVGIVGYGSVGRQVARLLYACGATVLAAKRDILHPQDSDYIPEGLGDPGSDFVRRMYPAQALRSMFKDCDFVIVAVPLTEQTRDLIGEAELAAFKPAAFIVDVSRGGIINQSALIAALRAGKIGGAALDVFPEEPLPADNPLWKLPNVIISPHISGITPKYDQRAGALFAENLQRYLSGQPLLNKIDPHRGY